MIMVQSSQITNWWKFNITIATSKWTDTFTLHYFHGFAHVQCFFIKIVYWYYSRKIYSYVSTNVAYRVSQQPDTSGCLDPIAWFVTPIGIVLTTLLRHSTMAKSDQQSAQAPKLTHNRACDAATAPFHTSARQTALQDNASGRARVCLEVPSHALFTIQ